MAETHPSPAQANSALAQPNWRRLGMGIAIARLLALGCFGWLIAIAAGTPSWGNWKLSGTSRSDVSHHDDPQVIALLTPYAAWSCFAGALGFAAIAIEALLAERIVRRGHEQLPGGLGTKGAIARNVLITASIAASSLAVAGLVSAALVATQGLKAASAEGGTLEVTQALGWLVCAVLAVVLGARLTDRSCRAGLLLLGVGALLAAAREIDLHERINPRALPKTVEMLGLSSVVAPDTAFAWGVRFRADWWLSTSQPIGPRLLWGSLFAAGGLLSLAVVRRGAGSILTPGAPLNRLMPLCGIVAVKLFFGWAADDLLRYRVPLRQAQIFEEAVELSAVLVFLALLAWAGHLGRLVTPAPASASSPPQDEPTR